MGAKPILFPRVSLRAIHIQPLCGLFFKKVYFVVHPDYFNLYFNLSIAIFVHTDRASTLHQIAFPLKFN